MKIILDEKINVFEKVKSVLKGGHLCGVYREADSLYAENILKDLTREYRVSRKILPSDAENDEETAKDIMNVSDDARLYVVFGGADVVECVKYAATMKEIKYIVILTTPCVAAKDTAYIFAGGSLRSYKASLPSVILGEWKYLMTRDGFEGLVGDIAYALLSSFDARYLSYMKNVYPKEDGVLMKAEEFACGDGLDKKELLKLASAVSNLKSNNSAELFPYYVKRGDDKEFSIGKYKFEIAYTILLLYSYYLKYDGDDLYYPPDIMNSVDVMNSVFRENIAKVMSQYRYSLVGDYVKHCFLMREYREELVSDVDRYIDVMMKLSKAFRRISSDGGYSLSELPDYRSLMKRLSALSVLEDRDTLLRHMKTDGILERYL